jgi:hypothetical protein
MQPVGVCPTPTDLRSLHARTQPAVHCAPSNARLTTHHRHACRVCACLPAHDQAVRRAMPPLPRRELRNLVRKLHSSARPAQQRQALEALSTLCLDDAHNSLAAIVAAGAVPSLVQLLGPGSSAEVQALAARALTSLAWDDDIVVTIIAAGAIPPLVQLLGHGSSALTQQQAVRVLRNLARHQPAVLFTAAIPSLVQLLGPGSSFDMCIDAADWYASLRAMRLRSPSLLLAPSPH